MMPLIKLLIKNNILAPSLYNESYRKNFIEIEDFGNNTIFNLLKKNSAKKINLYKDSIDLLNKIQKIKENKIKNFREKIYKFQNMIKKNYSKRQNYLALVCKKIYSQKKIS